MVPLYADAMFGLLYGDCCCRLEEAVLDSACLGSITGRIVYGLSRRQRTHGVLGSSTGWVASWIDSRWVADAKQ